MEEAAAKSRKPIIKLVAFLVIFTGLVIASRLPTVKEAVSLDAVSTHLDNLSEWANHPYGAALFVFLSAAFIVFYLPEIVVVIVAGLIFPLWLALLVTLAGCTLGTTATFLISRFFLRDYFRPRFENSFLARFEKDMEKHGILVMCLLRFLLFLFAPVNWWIGATGIRLRDYVIGTFLGILPWLFLILFAVGRLGSVEAVKDMSGAGLLIVVAPVAVMVVAVIFLRKRYIGNRENSVAEETSEKRF